MPHQFKNPELEQIALTHSSFGTPNNKRLEWLGDAILYGAISQVLWERFPDLDRGALTALRGPLVQNRILADAARRAGFPHRLRLGAAERADGLANSDAVLAAAAEAYLAAAHLDGGDAAEAAAELLAEPIAARARILERGGPAALKNHQERLHALLKDAGMPPPAYHGREFVKRGRRRFRARCEAGGQVFWGESRNMNRAKSAAAARALRRLEHSELVRPK